MCFKKELDSILRCATFIAAVLQASRLIFYYINVYKQYTLVDFNGNILDNLKIFNKMIIESIQTAITISPVGSIISIQKILIVLFDKVSIIVYSVSFVFAIVVYYFTKDY
jgi:hypothetical protein